jgi:hypothetical protein
MKFTLPPLSASTQIPTSLDLVSNTGGIHASVSSSPNPLVPNAQSTLRISFYDPTGTQPLTNTNVKYNLIIFDKNSHAILSKQNLLAKNATDIEAIVFPAKEIYHMMVAITGLLVVLPCSHRFVAYIYLEVEGIGFISQGINNCSQCEGMN